MIAGDVICSLRALKRTPGASLTIVATIGVGLGLVAAVFTLLNIFLFRVDAVPHPEELFAVAAADGRPPLTLVDYHALRRETDVFAETAAMIPEVDTAFDGRPMSAALVSGNFFQMLGVDAALGRTLTPGDDAAAGARPVVVLSHRGWTALFPNDAAVVGRTIVLNRVPYEIVGVMPEDFRGLAVAAPDYWAPLAMRAGFGPFYAKPDHELAIDIVGRLKAPVSRERALAGLVVWDSARRSDDRAGAARRPAGIALEPRRGTVPDPWEALLMFAPLFFVFGLVLVAGSANVANLLLARGMARQREIGIRLAIGAPRRRVVVQLLTESLLLALAAAAVGFAMSRAVLAGAIYGVLASMPPDMGDIDLDMPAADWRVAAFLLAGAVLSTAFFGLMPALQATRLELVRTIRGEILRDRRPGRSRSVLIALQVMVAALLLTGAAVFLRSAMAGLAFDPGLRTADTIVISIDNEPLRRPLLQAVAEEPLVRGLAAVRPNVLAPARLAGATANGRTLPAALSSVSAEYFDVLGIDILRGRGFTAAESTAAAGSVVVSETIARQLWPAGDPVGSSIYLDQPDTQSPGARPFTVIGVARDVPGFRFSAFEEAAVYRPARKEDAGTHLVARVAGDPEPARRALVARLTAVDPNAAGIITLRTAAGMELYFLQVGFSLTLALGGLAIVLTLSGVFSVLSYLVEQRRSEVGLRMALGATSRQVGELMLWQTVRPVGLGLLAGSGLAAAIALVLRSMPAAATVSEIVHVLDPVAYAAAVVVIGAACAAAALVPALRAARIDPMASLRQQ